MAEQIDKKIVAQIKAMSGNGMSEREIAKLLGVHQRSVGRYKVDPPAIKDQLFNLMKKTRKVLTLAEAADTLDVAPGKIRQALDELKAEKRTVSIYKDGFELNPAIPPSDPTRLDAKKFGGKTIKFGLCSDEHLGSKYHRSDVLNVLFDIWKDQGIEQVYSCGNSIDGEARFNKTDLLVYGMQRQVEFWAEHWPQRKGMKTDFITGDDHEGWYQQREGIDIGGFMESVARKGGREDLTHLGYMEHDILFEGKERPLIRLMHAGGGSAYATSYTAQKIVESYQGSEKPSILLIGHYHKAEYGYPREVHCVQAATCEDQTPFMRKKKLQAHVGGWTIEFQVDPNGIVHRFKSEFHPFFDRGFYGKNWEYRKV